MSTKNITFNFFFFLHKKTGQCGGASGWRVCYQRGLPCLVLICFLCYCCCCYCWSFCCCIMVWSWLWRWLMARSKKKLVFHNGETDVYKPGAAFATFVANRRSWSCLNQQSAPWLLLLLHVFVRKYLQTILLECSHFLWCMRFFVYKIVLTCFAFISLYIVLVYYIITSWH